jgi:hypothetical protein
MRTAVTGAANKAVVYQWESKRRIPSPTFWERIEQLQRRAWTLIGTISGLSAHVTRQSVRGQPVIALSRVHEVAQPLNRRREIVAGRIHDVIEVPPCRVFALGLPV